MTALKNSIESFNIRLDQIEEIISEWEGISFEISQKGKMEKRMKMSEEGLCELLRETIDVLLEFQKEKRRRKHI